MKIIMLLVPLNVDEYYFYTQGSPPRILGVLGLKVVESLFVISKKNFLILTFWLGPVTFFSLVAIRKMFHVACDTCLMIKKLHFLSEGMK